MTQLIAEAVEQMQETFEAGQEVPLVAAEESKPQRVLFEQMHPERLFGVYA